MWTDMIGANNLLFIIHLPAATNHLAVAEGWGETTKKTQHFGSELLLQIGSLEVILTI